MDLFAHTVTFFPTNQKTKKWKQAEDTKKTGFRLLSENNFKNISFQENEITLFFDGVEYQSFKDAKGVLAILNDFMQENLADQHILRIVEQKVNIVEFVLNNEVSGLTIFKELINEKLLGNIDYIPNINYFNQSLNKISFTNENKQLNIQYAYHQANEKVGQVVLELLLQIEKKETTLNTDMFYEMNMEIFNAFHWAITESYKSVMNQDDE
ncbi:MAG: hypothetical protein ACKVTZ_00475 [Bacteroidia bacterium]